MRDPTPRASSSGRGRRASGRSLNGATLLIFIVGDPVAQLKSPQSVTPLLRRRGADLAVVPAHVVAEDFGGFVEVARRTRNVAGIIATVPHKFAAFGLCAEVGPHAQITGAVNLMRRLPSGD